MKSLEVGIDKKATRNNALDALRKYNRFLKMMPIRSMPKVTQTYSFILPTTANGLNALESAVSKNIEREKLLKERERYIKLIHEAVNHLSDDGKYIVVNKYLSGEDSGDFNIYTDLGIGKTKYYSIKNDALIQLAMLLGIEEYTT
ncbi:ArpU family phage packaging/lysis transcriptional regulator [Macrococcus brunensis]|uniref:ArpU family phage packaging/lysis transcriptional regulator n=1 Tax=Macrococcus brunensis TaxID=198483 RepID=UPI001EF0F363|nr:ArpU family phage packaging/lysis transcriptional regulator [Macrococcus brunensis]ULG71913.1 ArpU family transcriptional regulator [Macrococcus brunensis]